jgi:adenosylhomocysteine nucleosidase
MPGAVSGVAGLSLRWVGWVVLAQRALGAGVSVHTAAAGAGSHRSCSGLARPRTWELSHRVHQIAAHLERTGDWARQLPGGLPSPRVHFGPVAAGESVHYSAVSDARQWLREHYSDAVAVEMEAAGVAQAGHLNDALPTIMVRGISDPADETKSAADDVGWQPRAAANAAAFATELASVLAAELDEGRGLSSRPRASGTGHGGPTNLATGNARVGVQGDSVTIHGGIQLGGPHSASETARTDQPSVRPGRLRLALHWARGVLRGAAGLAAEVAAIMTAVRSVT